MLQICKERQLISKKLLQLPIVTLPLMQSVLKFFFGHFRLTENLRDPSVFARSIPERHLLYQINYLLLIISI